MFKRLRLLLPIILIITSCNITACSTPKDKVIETAVKKWNENKSWKYTYNHYVQYFEASDTVSSDDSDTVVPVYTETGHKDEDANYYGIKLELVNNKQEQDISMMGVYMPEPYFSYYISNNGIDITSNEFNETFYQECDTILERDPADNVIYQYTRDIDGEYIYEIPQISEYEYLMKVLPTDITDWELGEEELYNYTLYGTYYFNNHKYIAQLELDKKTLQPNAMSLRINNYSSVMTDTDYYTIGWEQLDYVYMSFDKEMKLTDEIRNDRRKVLDATVEVKGDRNKNNYTLGYTTLSYNATVPKTSIFGDKFVELSKTYNVTVSTDPLKYSDIIFDALTDEEKEALQLEFNSQEDYPATTIMIPFAPTDYDVKIVDSTYKMYETIISGNTAIADITGNTDEQFRAIGIVSNDNNTFIRTNNTVAEALLDLPEVSLVPVTDFANNGNIDVSKSVLICDQQYFQITVNDLSHPDTTLDAMRSLSMNKPTGKKVINTSEGNPIMASYEYTDNYMKVAEEYIDDKTELKNMMGWYILDEQEMQFYDLSSTFAPIKPVIDYLFDVFDITDYDLAFSNGTYVCGFSKDRKCTIELMVNVSDSANPSVVNIYIEHL